MKRIFLGGLIVLLPLVLSIGLLLLLVDLFTQPFTPLLCNLSGGQPGLLFYASKIALLLLFLLLTSALGLLARSFLARHALKFGDQILQKIPFFNLIYTTTQDLFKNLLTSKNQGFKQVVLAPFPDSPSYVLGFIAKEAPKKCSRAIDSPLLSVLVPTSPNPITGFLLMCREEELIPLDMPSQEALKYLLSCGLTERKP